MRYPYTALWCKRWTWFAIRFYFAFWQDKTLWTKFFIWKFVYKCNYQLSIYKVLTTWFFFSYIYIYNTSDEKEWLWIWSHSLFRILQDLYLLALVVMSDEIWTKRLCNLIGLTGSSSAILIIGRGDSFSTSKSGVLVKHIHPLSTAHQNIPFNNVIYKMVWSLFI